MILWKPRALASRGTPLTKPCFFGLHCHRPPAPARARYCRTGPKSALPRPSRVLEASSCQPHPLPVPSVAPPPRRTKTLNRRHDLGTTTPSKQYGPHGRSLRSYSNSMN
ncbi:uncharacterized protein LOC144456291 [Phascolarctos cinereus]